MKYIDFHTHYHPVAGAAENDGLLREMDKLGIERSLVLATPEHPRYTELGMTGFNEEVFSFVSKHPDRLVMAAYIEPRNVMEAQTQIQKFHDRGVRFFKMWPGHGYAPDDPMIYPVWEKLNDRIMHPARVNSEISKVERRDGKVFITVNGKVEEYDKVIVTAPLYVADGNMGNNNGMVDYFDAREDELELFSKIDYERYTVQAFITEPKDHPEISYYVFDNMVKERLGHLMVYYRRWKESIDQVITTYALRTHKDMEEVPYDKCNEMVLEDLKIMHNPAKKVVNAWSVYYFPHVSCEDYAAGWYDKVEAMQGKYDTFYAGEVMSFGDMDETAEYSRELVERFF